MAKIGSEGDVTTRIGSVYDDTGTKAAEDNLIGFGKTSASVTEKMQKQWQSLQKHWLKVVAAIFALKKAWDFATAAAKFDQQQQAFTNLAASHGANARQIIADLKEMSGQTVSTAGLMESAGTAMLLGIPANKLSRLMEIARSSARVMGTDVQTAFNDIAKGVGRQSPLILDNLGITVKLEKAYTNYAKEMKTTVAAMTDAEKKQAFLNAVMIAGGEIVQRVGVQSMTAAEGMAMFTAKMEDAKIFVGKLLISITSFLSSIATGFSTVFAGTLSLISTMISRLIALGSRLPFVGDKFKAAAAAVNEFAEFEKEAAIQAANMSKKSTEVALAVWEEKKAVGALTDAQIKQRSSAAKAAAQKKADEEAIKKFQKVNKDLITDIKSMEDAYKKAILTEEAYIIMKAKEMAADGKSTELIKQWTAAKMESLELQRAEVTNEAAKQAEIDRLNDIVSLNEGLAQKTAALNEEYRNLTLSTEELNEFRAIELEAKGADLELMNQLIEAERLLNEEKQIQKEEKELAAAEETLAPEAELEDPEVEALTKLIALKGQEAAATILFEKQKAKAVAAGAKVTGQAYAFTANALANLVATGEFSAKAWAAAMFDMAANAVLAIGQEAAVRAAMALGMFFFTRDPSYLKAAAAFGQTAAIAGVAGIALKAAAIGLRAESEKEKEAQPTFEADPFTGTPTQQSNVFNTTTQQGQVTNDRRTYVTVEGNIVDQAAFARDLQPFLGEADEDRVRAA